MSGLNKFLVLDVTSTKHFIDLDSPFFKSVEEAVLCFIENPAPCSSISQALKKLSALTSKINESSQPSSANPLGFLFNVMEEAVTTHNSSAFQHSPGCQLFTSGLIQAIK